MPVSYTHLDGHERKGVVVVGFPKLSGNAEVVVAVVRGKLIVADLVPLFSGCDAGGAQIVYAQSDGRAPGNSICLLYTSRCV